MLPYSLFLRWNVRFGSQQPQYIPVERFQRTFFFGWARVAPDGSIAVQLKQVFAAGCPPKLHLLGWAC